jgi:broad specificity phosphatase PhoE
VTTTIVLVRHGETDWNRESRFQGHADPPLNALGRAQAETLAGELTVEPVAIAYTSPLRRAKETAEILASRLDVEVRTNDALMEVDVGSWSGLTRGEVESRYAEGYRRWLEYGHGWDDGETYDELGRRVVRGLLEIGARHDGENVLAVTHGGPIRSALAAAGGIGFDEARRSLTVVGNCATIPLVVRAGRIEHVERPPLARR